MSTKGWNSLKPITTPDQMSAPIHWNPMNEDWKMRLTKSQIKVWLSSVCRAGML